MPKRIWPVTKSTIVVKKERMEKMVKEATKHKKSKRMLKKEAIKSSKINKEKTKRKRRRKRTVKTQLLPILKRKVLVPKTVPMKQMRLTKERAIKKHDACIVRS